MAGYSPTISNVIPSVSVTLPNGVTYQQFLASLGSWVYWFDVLYLFTDTQAQLSQPMNYNYTNIDGNERVLNVIPAVDPYQFAKSLFLNIQELDIVLDGQATVSFNLMPYSFLKLKLYGDSMAITYLLGAEGNKEELVKTMGMPDFYKIEDVPPDYIMRDIKPTD